MEPLLDRLLGLHVPAIELTWAQMGARTLLTFAYGLFLMRIADRRFLGHNAGFDVLLAIVLGSVLSRAINGQAPFFATFAACLLLVLLHRGVAAIASRWPLFSRVIKGDPHVLVKDGEIRRDTLRQCDLSQEDLEENLRLNGNTGRASGVAEARLERNGHISVVKMRKES
jgi:uncharacterized membrane protein YcaP (DUF421 family)